ncbi:MAG: site-specific integrase [Actinobacteria bacterium]|nr:site-specific integrase [Actinomycetota bacterium]
MAHIQDRWRSKDGTPRPGPKPENRWQARYTGPDGIERTKSFRRKVDAERFLTTIEAAKLRGDWVDPAAGRITLREWAPRWLATKRRLKPKTRAGYESIQRSRILPVLGALPLNGLERAQVEAWISDMLDGGLSASRVRESYHVLSSMMEAAVVNGLVTRNVVRGVELPRVEPTERRFVTAAQVEALAAAMPKRFRALPLVVAYGGLRWGEAVALRRRRVNLLHGRIEVAEAATEINGKLSWGLPKTHQIGSVDVPRFVAETLERHLDRHVEDDADALVFTAEAGGPLRHSNFLARVWRPALAVAKLPADLTPHELRHTCAALLIAEGADPKAIQAQLRHSSIQVTFDVYGHLFPGHLDSVMDRLDHQHRARNGTETERRRNGPEIGGLGLAP